ncbi:MAG: histidinol-phosphate transaminase [candidate division Zixibacteria bacterium]|nr:histidinol-phosphate transaminase [candidate division Zixibacteria bacterium]
MKPDSNLSRRGFIGGTLLGGLGALAVDPMVMAQALVSGKKPEDIQGHGIAPGYVNLSSNENPLGPSPRAVEAVAARMFGVNRYHWSFMPDPSEVLINALERKHGLPVTETTWDNWEEVTKNRRLALSAGSSMILHAVGLATVRDKAELVQAQPAYFDTADVWRRFKEEEGADVKVNYVRLTRDLRHNLNAMYERINDNTTVVVVTNPNNPTSTVVDHDALVDFVRSVPSHVTVFIDEAYIDYTTDPDYRDAMYLTLEHDNVIVSRTFSKIYGLAGMRVGYAALSPRLRRKLSLYNLGGPPGNLALYAAIAALDDHGHYERSRRTVEEGKAYLGEAFERLDIPYTPSDSCFVLFRLGDKAESVFSALQERNVWIGDAMWWGLKGHLRVTVGTPDENEAFINTLEAVL